jgi:hypothetical protein
MFDVTKMVVPVGMVVLSFLHHKFGAAGVYAFGVVAWSSAAILKVLEFRKARK